MTATDPSQLSRRSVLGVAGAALTVPLRSDGTAARVPALPQATPVASLADLARPTGAVGVGTRNGSLAAVLRGLPLDARVHGVVGDGSTDDTRAVQAFLDLCAEQGGRIAWFGALVVRITGPLVSRVGIVFEPASYGAPDVPGFVASGSGYTALTVLGSVADFCVTVTGDGTIDIPENGRIAGDRRPRIDGIAFGTDAADGVFAMSTVRAVRVNNLAGFGVRHAQCWDSTFLSVSVERCGRDDRYAFEVAGNGGQTCNETSWVRVHVEQAVGGSIRIDPSALSCSFLKIHSERAIASPNVPTWLLGGSCVYDSVRLTAMNPTTAQALVVSNQGDFRNLRAEGGIRVVVNATGGTVNFHNPGAVLQPAADQGGIVNVTGGVLAILGMGAGWHLQGCRVTRLEVGFMPAGLSSSATGCIVEELVAQRGADQGELVLRASTVLSGTIAGSGRLRALHLLENSRFTPAGGTLACTDQLLVVDGSSQVLGNLLLQRARMRLAGAIGGSLVVRGPVHDAQAADGASVGGTVAGWGPPSVAGTAGAWSANLSPARTGAVGRNRAVVGWRYVAEAWRPAYVDIEG